MKEPSAEEEEEEEERKRGDCLDEILCHVTTVWTLTDQRKKTREIERLRHREEQSCNREKKKEVKSGAVFNYDFGQMN